MNKLFLHEKRGRLSLTQHVVKEARYKSTCCMIQFIKSSNRDKIKIDLGLRNQDSGYL